MVVLYSIIKYRRMEYNPLALFYKSKPQSYVRLNNANPVSSSFVPIGIILVDNCNPMCYPKKGYSCQPYCLVNITLQSYRLK